MTTDNENVNDGAERQKRVAPACEVFDMLTAHADNYLNSITITKVQDDIEATFGVRLDRGAISSRLRNIAVKGLIVRVAETGSGENSRGWWVFSDRVLRTLGKQPAKAAKSARSPRGLLKVKNGKKGKSREYRDAVESFIRASKKKDRELIFTADSVVDYLRLAGLPVQPRSRIAKALGNMIFQQCGVVKTGRHGVYCVPSEEDRFNKSAVRRPDVSVPKKAPRKVAKRSGDPELRELFRDAAEGYAMVQRAMARLSDLVGTFKE
jgi:hypothetical protein